jgi:hypothetical protein
MPRRRGPSPPTIFPAMLTRRHDIVTALPPKRNRAKPKAAAVPKAPVIVEARDPRRIRRKPAVATRVVDHRKGVDVSEEDQRRAGEADRLW